jgi:hypothetical protein
MSEEATKVMNQVYDAFSRIMKLSRANIHPWYQINNRLNFPPNWVIPTATMANLASGEIITLEDLLSQAGRTLRMGGGLEIQEN